MYRPTFKQASIWAVLWRAILATIGVSLIAGILMALFNFEHLTFLSIVMDGLLYFAFYKIVMSQMRKQSLSIEALSKPGPKNKKALLKMSGITLLVALAASTFIYFFMSFLTLIPPLFDLIMPYFIDMAFGEEVPILYIVMSAVIFAPIVEEIVFRGYVLNKWVDKYGVSKGIWFSSLAFMILHFQSLFVPQLLLGLFCGIIYTKYKNLFYPIFIHALYNFLVLAPALFAPPADPMDFHFQVMELMGLRDHLPFDYIILSVLFIIALVLLVILFKRLVHSVKKNQSPYTENLSNL